MKNEYSEKIFARIKADMEMLNSLVNAPSEPYQYNWILEAIEERLSILNDIETENESSKADLIERLTLLQSICIRVTTQIN